MKYITSNAVFSDDRKYRYQLIRQWSSSKPFITFIGLNPSTADENKPDPTITRIIGFAKSFNYGGIYMCNLFAYVSTDPKKLLISGEDLTINNCYIADAVTKSEAVVFCWGAFKETQKRMNDIIKMLPDAYCLGKTKSGNPKHPLYLKADTQLIKFQEKENGK